MAHSDPIDRGVIYLQEWGYDVVRSADRAEPAAVATPGDDARTPVGVLGAADQPVALERLARDEADPTTVLERVAHADRRGRFCLFVVNEATARTVRDILTDPPGVVHATPAGHRTFYNVPDRIRLDDGSYAADRRFAPEYRWTEEPVGNGAVRLVLHDGPAVVAALDSVDTLACPSPTAFPFHYRRGGDKRLHVADDQGRHVGSFGSIRAMRTAGFSLIPVPLVPEHTMPGRDIDGAWAVAVVEDGELVRVERAE